MQPSPLVPFMTRVLRPLGGPSPLFTWRRLVLEGGTKPSSPTRTRSTWAVALLLEEIACSFLGVLSPATHIN
jgi:hypothetical protein